MKVIFSLLLLPIVILACPSPPLPLGATFDQAGPNITYHCQGGLRGVGHPFNTCHNQQWEEVRFSMGKIQFIHLDNILASIFLHQ